MNPSDYMKQLGRDGTYLECDVQNLHELINLAKGDQPFPKMIVLKAGRLELTDPNHIAAFQKLLKQFAISEETASMSSEQLGFYVFRKIFEYGLDDYKP